MPRRGNSTYNSNTAGIGKMASMKDERLVQRENDLQPGLFRKGFSTSGVEDSLRSSTHREDFLRLTPCSHVCVMN